MTPSKERVGSPKRPNLLHTKSPSTPSPLRTSVKRETDSEQTTIPHSVRNAVSDSKISSSTRCEPLDDTIIPWPLRKDVHWPKGDYWLLCHKTLERSATKSYSYARKWFTHLECCEKCQSLLQIENRRHRPKGEYWTPCSHSSVKNHRMKPFSYGRCWLKHINTCDYCSNLKPMEQARLCGEGEYWSLCTDLTKPFNEARQWFAHAKSCAECQNIIEDETATAWVEGEYYALCGRRKKVFKYTRCWLEHLENCADCERILEKERTRNDEDDESIPTLKKALSFGIEELGERQGRDEEMEPAPGNESNIDDGSRPVLDERPNPSHWTHRRIQELIRQDLSHNEQLGYIYVLYSPKDGFRKIGRSKTVAERTSRIQKDCRMSILEISIAVKYPDRAEKLIQAELSGLGRPFLCEMCGKNHKEWYQVEKAVAEKSVQKWVNFINKEPYHERTKELKPFWMYRIVIQEIGLEIDRLEGKTTDLETLQKYWAEILSPSFYDRNRYEMKRYFEHYWKGNAIFAWILIIVLSLQQPNIYSIIAIGLLCTSSSWFVSGEIHEFQEFMRLHSALVGKKGIKNRLVDRDEVS